MSDVQSHVSNWVTALGLPVIAILNYYRRKSIRYKFEEFKIEVKAGMEQLNKRFDELQLAIIKQR